MDYVIAWPLVLLTLARYEGVLYQNFIEVLYVRYAESRDWRQERVRVQSWLGTFCSLFERVAGWSKSFGSWGSVESLYEYSVMLIYLVLLLVLLRPNYGCF